MSAKPLPRKDCRICNKRRIKCDRTLPNCRKCEARGYTCPGYGDRLKWGFGIASRGRLRGKQTPAAHVAPSKSSKSRPPSREREEEEEEEQEAERDEEGKDASSPILRPSTTPCSSFGQAHSENILLHHYVTITCRELVWSDGPHNPWRTQVLQLALATRSRSSALMTTILALAAVDLSRRFNGLSSLSGGSSLMFDVHRDRALACLANVFRLRRERDLAKFGRHGTETDIDIGSEETNGILAAIILLYYLEWKCAGLRGCQVHLQAAAAILQPRPCLEPYTLGLLGHDYNNQRHNFSQQQEISAFLVHEYLSLKLWTQFSDFGGASVSKTDFHEDSNRNGHRDGNHVPLSWYLFPRDRRWIFTEYVSLIDRISDYDRHKRTGKRMVAKLMNDTSTDPDPTTTGEDLVTVSEIYAGLSNVYQQTLALQCHGQADKDIIMDKNMDTDMDMNHVATMYCHAVLIYGQQVLELHHASVPLLLQRQTHDAESEQTWWFAQHSRDEIFHHLSCIRDFGGLSQGLFWPLFIAGTECTGLVEQQQLLETTILEMIAMTGGYDRLTCLQFLKGLWGANCGDGGGGCYDGGHAGFSHDSDVLCKMGRRCDWIDMAVEWAHEGRKFLIL